MMIILTKAAQALSKKYKQMVHSRCLRHRFWILLYLPLLLCLTGCVQDFDAKRYVQASLDACVHGDYSDFMEMTRTEAADAQNMHDSLIQQEVTHLDQYCTEVAVRQKFFDLFDRAYRQFRYEVGEGIRQGDDSYLVPVTTYKLKLFGNIIDDTRAYIDDFYHSDLEKANGTISHQELNGIITDYLYDYLKDHLEHSEYEEGVTIQVTVAPSEHAYSLNSGELQQLIDGLSDSERLEE